MGPDERVQRRLSVLEEEIKRLQPKSPIGDEAVGLGERLSKADEFERIDIEDELKKKDAREESDVRIKGFKDELAEAEKSRDQIAALEQQKKEQVIAALNARATETAAIFAKIEADTERHIQVQIEQFARLAAAARAPAVPAVRPGVRRAGGGPVFGPGGPTDDMVPALLSNGEFVVKASAYAANKQIVEAINAGLKVQLPRFAEGGPVNQSYDQSRTIHVNQHYHGETARVMSNPARLRYHARLALR